MKWLEQLPVFNNGLDKETMFSGSLGRTTWYFDQVEKSRNHRLLNSASDTDHLQAKQISFFDESSKQFVGPMIKDGDTVSVQFAEPETYRLDNSDGITKSYLIQGIVGSVKFNYLINSLGKIIKSAPIRVGFTEGSFTALDPRTNETWEQEFEGDIDLRVNSLDTVEVIQPDKE
jgi:hypothetical protein